MGIMGWDPLLSWLGNNFESVVSKYRKMGVMGNVVMPK